MKRAGVSSQAELSQITGVSQSQIGNILRQKKGVSISVLERLAQGLESEPWLMLAPSDFFEKQNTGDFLPMMLCYMKLNEDAQASLWKIIYDLYDASSKGYRG